MRTPNLKFFNAIHWKSPNFLYCYIIPIPNRYTSAMLLNFFCVSYWYNAFKQAALYPWRMSIKSSINKNTLSTLSILTMAWIAEIRLSIRTLVLTSKAKMADDGAVN